MLEPAWCRAMDLHQSLNLHKARCEYKSKKLATVGEVEQVD